MDIPLDLARPPAWPGHDIGAAACALPLLAVAVAVAVIAITVLGPRERAKD